MSEADPVGAAPSIGAAPETGNRAPAIGLSLVQVLIACLLAGAIYASSLAYVVGLEAPVHLFTISSLLLASAAAVLARIRLDGRFNSFEITILAAYVCSFIAHLIDRDDYVLYYTVVSAITVALCAIIARAVSTRLILNAAVAAYLLMALTIFAFYSPEIFRALNAHSANRWLIRIVPFGIHPDLLGLIFGAGMVLLLCRAATAPPVMKVVLGVGAALSLALVLAASARSSLLALAIDAGLMAALLFPRMTPRARAGVTWMAAGMIFVTVMFFGSIVSYLNVILELDSGTRGLGSGGSGRTDAWSQGLDLVAHGGANVLVGGGLRWASIDNIGFSTEDSYLTILLESGVIVGILIIVAIYRAIANCYMASRHERDRTEWWNTVAALGVLMFAAIESFFNRYLLAIGNPLSLLLMLLFLSYSYVGPAATREGARGSRH